MKKYEKELFQHTLESEQAVIDELKKTYIKALKDIEKKSKELATRITQLQDAFNVTTDETQKEVIKSMIQSKVYQKQYQDALKKQIGSILDNLQVENFKTLEAYLQKCYEDGFVGVMYSLQNQGIPIITPINQEKVLQAVQIDSKISQGLYTRLGEDIASLKKRIASEVSRGIATSIPFQQIAQNLAGISLVGYNNAIRIARTEGHRVQTTAAMNACADARDKGCNIVKQWDSTLDKRTRPSHRRVDGEIREVDETFSNGLMFPGDPNGKASEVINCRCALLERSKWALAESELDTLKERAAYFGLDKTDNFNDFKAKYLQALKDTTAP